MAGQSGYVRSDFKYNLAKPPRCYGALAQAGDAVIPTAPIQNNSQHSSGLRHSFVRGELARVRRARSAQRLAAIILVASIFAYPLLGTLVVFTDFTSLFASVPVRLFVVFSSALLVIRTKHRRNNFSLGMLYLFWAIYALRLIMDYWGADIPGTDIDGIFFLATCVIPVIAITRVPGGDWNEALIARWLAVSGALICAFALLPLMSGVGTSRSLFEETGRLSFDTVNPITYGHVAVTTIVGAIVSLRRAKRVKQRLLWMGCIIVAAPVLYLAGSRGPALALAACLASFLLLLTSTKRFVLPVLSISIVAMLCASLLNLDSTFWQHFFSFENDPSTLERIFLQINAIEQFLNNPLLGSAHVELQTLSYPHNPLIEAGMATGVLGFLLFAILSVQMAFRGWWQLRHGETLIPLLGLQYLLGAQFSGNLSQSAAMWILMAMIFSRGKRMSFGNTLVHLDGLSKITTGHNFIHRHKRDSY